MRLLSIFPLLMLVSLPLRADPPRRITAREYAASFNDPIACEAEARRFLADDKEKGWALLKACVALGHEPDIRTLLQSPWLEELRQRPDAGVMLGQLIALRGGNMEHDVGLCQASRVPVFGLTAALAEPAAYQGEIVLLRGTVKERRTRGGQTAVEVAETMLRSDVVEIVRGPLVVTDDATATTYDLAGTTRMTGGVNGVVSVRDDTRRANMVVEQRTVTSPVETGQTFIGRVDRADPFLSVGAEYVLVVRFKGSAPPDDGSESPRGTGTVLGYFRPMGRVAY